MGRTVAELGAALTSAELTEWLAYEQLEPWGEERMDWRFAVLDSLLANQWRGRGDRPVMPEAFVPDFDGGREALERERAAAAWGRWAQTAGA